MRIRMVSWGAHECLAVRESAVDVGAAAELCAEEHLDGVGEQVSQTDDRRVEDDHRGLDGADGGQHRRHDARIDDGRGHRTALATHRMMSRRAAALRPKPTRRSGMTVL
jgi:hypothetical protein